jgi:hypothetical protein
VCGGLWLPFFTYEYYRNPRLFNHSPLLAPSFHTLFSASVLKSVSGLTLFLCSILLSLCSCSPSGSCAFLFCLQCASSPVSWPLPSHPYRSPYSGSPCHAPPHFFPFLFPWVTPLLIYSVPDTTAHSSSCSRSRYTACFGSHVPPPNFGTFPLNLPHLLSLGPFMFQQNA